MLRLLLVFLLGLLPAAAGPGRAATGEEAFPGFASTRFADIEAAVAALAATGEPRAALILEALGEGRLLVHPGERKLYLREPGGELRDAATGEIAPPGAAAALKPVRVNNRVRRAVEAALGSLGLASPDPRRRVEAAQAVLRARSVADLPALERALAAEEDPAAREALQTARAAILAVSPSAAEGDRLAAVELLGRRGGQEALAVLRSLPEGAPEAVRAAAAEAIAAAERRQRLLAVGQNLLHGVSLGSVLLLAAIGLAVTFGVMGVINMAHGEMVMLGAYATFAVQELCRAFAPGLLDWSLLAALPAAFLAAGAAGVLIERGIIRHLYGRPLETLLATWGLSLILQQLVRSLFGASNREVASPSWLSGSVELAGGFAVTLNRLAIVLFCLAVFTALLALIRWSRFGLEMRAVTQNRRMAAAMGIRTSRVDALTFGLGSGVAGIAGVALSQIDNVSPNLGQAYIIDSFMVVVFGGVGNLWGTLTGAFALGIANKLLEPTVGAVLGKILVLVAIILFIQKRPSGLFALRGRAVEA